ncbi:MAG: hypothetical protein LUB58_05475, partial [Oscillospiraceae bacterium]|nr:hypothetical protein [Oscillospiraceae bacterium]
YTIYSCAVFPESDLHTNKCLNRPKNKSRVVYRRCSGNQNPEMATDNRIIFRKRGEQATTDEKQEKLCCGRIDDPAHYRSFDKYSGGDPNAGR